VERKPLFNPVQTWKQLRWAFRSYKRLQILRFYWSNIGLYTGILHRRFAGATHRTNFPGRILWRYCYRKFHLVAPGIDTDFGPVGCSHHLEISFPVELSQFAFQADISLRCSLGCRLGSPCAVWCGSLQFEIQLPLSRTRRFETETRVELDAWRAALANLSVVCLASGASGGP